MRYVLLAAAVAVFCAGSSETGQPPGTTQVSVLSKEAQKRLKELDEELTISPSLVQGIAS